MAHQAKDVVCGMMVDPDTTTARATYKGETYYFCAPDCRAAFERDPEKYLIQESISGSHHAHHH